MVELGFLIIVRQNVIPSSLWIIVMLNGMLFVFCLQEIAWQRLDELQPANDDVISRGITGLKLYMVAPFLAWVLMFYYFDYFLWCFNIFVQCLKDSISSCRSLKSWISTHQSPIAPKPDMPLKGFPSPVLLKMW